MKVVITGGAGYLGSVLVETLLQRKLELGITKLIVYDNLMYKQNSLFPFAVHPEFEFVFGNVRQDYELIPLVERADVVIPLAAIVGFPACDADPELAWEVNTIQLETICSIKSNFKLIYPNTNSGYGTTEGSVYCTEETALNPVSVYGQSKCAAEKFVLDFGGISLRLATVFGASYRFRKDLLVNDFVLKALTDKYIVLFESSFKRNYIHVRDVVETFIHMIVAYEKFKGQAFNVGLSSANLSKLELCEAIKKHVPDFVIKLDEFQKDKDKRNYIVSNAKLEATGWKSKYDLDFGIRELIRAYEIFLHANTEFTNL